MTDGKFEPPADHLTITTDPYLGVERRENALAIRREGKDVVIEESNVTALVAALETLTEQAYRPTEIVTSASPLDVGAQSVSTEDVYRPPDEDGDDGRECPECGADVVEALGGARCSACEWTDSDTDNREIQ